MQTSENETVLGDYSGLVGRRWFLILLGVVIGLAVGVGVLAVSPKIYESTTSVLVQPTGDDTNVTNGRTAATINLDTEAQIVTSTDVAARSVKLMQSSLGPRDLAKKVSVQVPANTSVLKITFAASSPTGAQKGAEAFAQAYLDNRKGDAEDKIQVTVEGLEATIDSLNTSLLKVNEDLETATTNSRRAYLAAQRDVLIQQIRTSTSSLSPLKNQEVQPGAVITQAQEPTSPTGLNPLLVLISAVFAGLLLGLVAAVARDRRDHRVRTRHDLDQLHLDVLAGRFTLPRADGVLDHDRTHDASLGQCRNALLARLVDHKGSLVVASASSQVSGDTAAASLAVALAHSGVKTVLVCCNAEGDVTAGAFDVPSSPSLADVLRSGVRPAEAMHSVPAVSNLSVVPAGPEGERFSALLQDPTVGSALAEFESLAEVVILDVAATAVNADAQTVVTATQGLLLVVIADVTSTDEVIDAMDQISHVNGKMLGALLVDVPRGRSRASKAESARRPATLGDDDEHEGRRIAASAGR